MKLATYFRDRGDEVRFFKGDMRDLAVELLFEEFWAEAYDITLGEYTNLMRQHIKTGKLAPLNDIPEFSGVQRLRDARARYKAGNYPKFDLVCVTTLFTFYWKETIETIEAAKKFVSEEGRIIVGGIASSILPEEIEKATGIKPYLNDRSGALLDKPGQIDPDSEDIIDELPLDYSILEEIDYVYPVSNAYFGYMTRGCVNRCYFCAVPTLEPKYCQHICIKRQIEQTTKRFGAQKDLLLLDNNVLASRSFNEIIDEIKELGFGVDATVYTPPNEYTIAIENIRNHYNSKTYVRKAVKFYDSVSAKLSETEQGEFYNVREALGLLYADTATAKSVLKFDKTFSPLYEAHIFRKLLSRGQVRYVDFNQGVDARLVTEEKMKKLVEVNIRPLRIAFDRWDVDPQRPSSRPMREVYENAVRLAVKYGIRDLSNYLLYNTNEDTPDELYLRLQLNVKLCEELKVNIYSFPMKYHPVDDPDYFDNRNFIGNAWNRKFIRAVQAVLNSTHGKIGRGKSFFEAAFGKTLEQFHEILLMPEAFIIERYKYDRKAYEAYLANGGTKKLNPKDVDRYGGMADEWREKFSALTSEQRKQAERIIYGNIFTEETVLTDDSAVNDVLQYYRIKRDRGMPELIAED